MDSERRSSFQKLLAKIKVTKELYGWVAEVLTPVEAHGLGNIFRRVDRNNDGTIDVDDLDEAVERGNFSSSIRTNLMQMRSTLSKYPKVSLDIRPFLRFTDKKSQSEP
jgi:Ca2+-binding EF-hand superfamily protein